MPGRPTCTPTGMRLVGHPTTEGHRQAVVGPGGWSGVQRLDDGSGRRTRRRGGDGSGAGPPLVDAPDDELLPVRTRRGRAPSPPRPRCRRSRPRRRAIGHGTAAAPPGRRARSSPRARRRESSPTIEPRRAASRARTRRCLGPPRASCEPSDVSSNGPSTPSRTVTGPYCPGPSVASPSARRGLHRDLLGGDGVGTASPTHHSRRPLNTNSVRLLSALAAASLFSDSRSLSPTARDASRDGSTPLLTMYCRTDSARSDDST